MRRRRGVGRPATCPTAASRSMSTTSTERSRTSPFGPPSTANTYSSRARATAGRSSTPSGNGPNGSERSCNVARTRQAGLVLRIAAGGAAGAAGGVPLPRLPARRHRYRRPGFRGGRRRRTRRDRPRDADAERRRRAAPLRLEPLQLRLPRPGPLAPDRPRLPLLADPHPRRRRRSASAADREGDRAGGDRREDRLHAAAHRPLHARRQRRREHARRRRRQRRRRLRRPRRQDVRGQGPLGERRRDAAPQLRLLVPAAQERAHLLRVRRAERVRARLRPRRCVRRPLRQPTALLEPRAAQARADGRPRRDRADPTRGALASRSRRRAGLRRRGALEHDVALPPRERRLGCRSGDRRRERRARGVAVPRTGTDHRPAGLDGRPLPLLLELASRRPASVRRLRSRQPEADRPALARRPARQAERRRPRAERWAADDPALAGRAATVRHQLALLDLGQPVLPGPSLLAAACELRSRRRDGSRPRLLRRPARPPGRAGAGARGAAAKRRLHDGDLPVRNIASAWDPAPIVLVGAGLSLLLFAQGFVRLRQRGRRDQADWTRAGLFFVAVAVGTLALVSPLDEVGDSYLLSGHMLQHVLIGDAAPALVVVALRGPLLVFILPRFVLRPLARLHWLRRLLAFLLRPPVSLAA